MLVITWKINDGPLREILRKPLGTLKQVIPIEYKLYASSKLLVEAILIYE